MVWIVEAVFFPDPVIVHCCSEREGTLQNGLHVKPWGSAGSGGQV
jgi:hypothetical protein